MLRSLYSAVSGMNAFQTELDVVGNNIANVDTTGFKSGRAEFSDILSQTMAGASAPAAGASIGGTNPVQVGLGVNVAAVHTLFTQGADQETGVPTDVALDGDGLFMVSKNATTNQPTTAGTAPTVTTVGSNSSVYYTRAGNFSVDANGNIVLPDGSKLLGYLSTTSPVPTQPSGLAAVNVSVIPSGGTNTEPGNWAFSPNGTITVYDPSTGNTVDTWVVPLAKFSNPAGLQKIGDSLYQPTTNSGQFLSPSTTTQGAVFGQAGANGFASFRPGALEASNVNLTNEFTSMIVAQQAFDANSKVINTDNNILGTIQNLEQQA